MNKSNQIKDIVKEIQRIVPEIMELKFGCKIIVKNYDELDNGIFISNGSYKTETGFRLFDVKKQDEYIKQILGREITLQDLLFCISETGVVISFRGSYKSLFFNENQDDEQHYDLTKSFLENLENDEFREFIYQLICK